MYYSVLVMVGCASIEIDIGFTDALHRIQHSGFVSTWYLVGRVT